MAYNGPAYQNMISRDIPKLVHKQLLINRRVHRAEWGDCYISDMKDIPSYDLAYEQGFRCRYRLNFTSYIGWKVYMCCTGIYACDLAHE